MLADIHVFPTSVGMNRLTDARLGGRMGVPHVRGDEPLRVRAGEVLWLCSPRPWG